METAVINLHSVFEHLRAQVDVLNESIEPQFIQMALNFEDSRRKWLRLEQELNMCKEVVTKAETEKGALEVKLKHARNQVDVEIRRRQKAEADCAKLDRQIQLIRELLVSEGSGNSIQLNEEQRSALAFLNARSQNPPNLNTSRRLTTIDESASILSDISYDKTDDSLDWDSSAIRTVRLKKRQKRRSSRNHTDGPPATAKRSRSTGRTSEKGNESLVTKTTVTVPSDGGPIEAVTTVEAVPYWTRSRRKTAAMEWDTVDTDSVQSLDVFKHPSHPSGLNKAEPSTPQGGGVRLHEFVSKTVIKPESCVPCGKRIKFGKISLKCRDCRVVAHPECRERCPLPCIPTTGGTPVKSEEGTLASYVSTTSPMIPTLVVRCVNEIEQRGMRETGLYRVSGSDRVVKELKEKFLRGKNVPLLSKVEDIHAITGLLKDFLRNLKEPLLTFRLNRTFMDAAEVPDDGNSIALMYQNISDLPQPNRDTLAFLIIHLQRVAQSTDTKMDTHNLARVFGPTIVGHAVPDPEPMTILQDTRRQPKVVERLMGLPVEYWSQFMISENEHGHNDHMVIENANAHATPDQKTTMFGPITTPDQQMSKTPSTSSLSQRMKTATLNAITPKFGSRSRAAASNSRQGNFFASPLLK
ncbi:rac GTPase-activating protein 1 [Paramisgurnus dabryanus]|uniref:rac GTPase-activating protein 1 n=1 Tax=Paramisgurnus dabryanus TaxID=90735 RepID=UPI0031F34BC1